MKTVLMVAEKPQLAQSLAKILSNGQLSSRKGLNGVCPVLEYQGTFLGERAKFKMTSVCGHVMSLDFLGKYNNWEKVDPAELFNAPAKKKEATEKLRMPHFLTCEGRGVDYLVLWLDCDKEGENICFEVIDCIQPVMNRPRGNQQIIYRAKFSAITDSDIKAAMNKLGEPNENEALSVDARQELDLRIGCAFTRFQTKFFQGKYGNLDSSLISYGPCQTPTLGFCVDRHDRIKSFKPEPYWVLHVKINVPRGRPQVLDWDRVRIFDREIAMMFLNMVKSSKDAQVVNIQTKEKSKQRPQALNTVELMRVASATLGMGPHHAMQIAERLYIQGYISYPRTETTHYHENFNLSETLKQQLHGPHHSIVQEILNQGISKARKGHDAGDHPPITPMKSVSEAELDGESWRLYQYISQHFIATVSPDCTYKQTTISFLVGKESFTLTGKRVINPGFTKVMDWQAIGDQESLPDLKKGDSCPIAEVKLVDRETSAPDYLTESELITLMEKHGIGTDASIPVHINNICQRNYVKVEPGRKLLPTPLGIVLVHGYQNIDPDLCLPTMRSALEEQLNLIAQGKVNFRLVLNHALEIFKLKFQYFVQQINNMDELFEVSFSKLAESGRPFSKCGKCRRYMKYIEAKPSRLYCMTCDSTYSLPASGNIKLYQELKCPLDDFELLMWTTGTKGKSFPFCPYCFGNPPFPDMHKGSGCNECTHPVCERSLTRLGVSQCLECQDGILVLDPTSAPKWKLTCNKCPMIVKIFEDAHRISVSSNNTCPQCEAAILKIDFNKNKNPLEGENTEYSGCAFCDPKLIPLVKAFHAKRQVNSRSHGGRGRGRGRGRGGLRGKGRFKLILMLLPY